jgi:hypothetical protein
MLALWVRPAVGSAHKWAASLWTAARPRLPAAGPDGPPACSSGGPSGKVAPWGAACSSAGGGHGRGGPAALHQQPGRQQGCGGGAGGAVQLLGRTAAGAVVMPCSVPLSGRMAFATQVRTGRMQGF